MQVIETGGGLSIANARKYLGGISQSKMYELIRSSAFETYRIGNRRYVLISELNRIMTEQSEG